MREARNFRQTVSSIVRRVAFGDLASADLVVDAVYEGGRTGNTRDDPLQHLIPVGNQGGFRYSGSPRLGTCRFVALYTSGSDPDWPDDLDRETGRFLYFGDNKTPGRVLHDTRRGGNALLRDVYAAVHAEPPQRDLVPPFFVFQKTGVGRDVAFLGLAAPGARDVTPRDDLVAIWKTAGSQRFQNYRAVFTILDTPMVLRTWIDALLADRASLDDAPTVWRQWVGAGVYAPMIAERIQTWRSRSDQLPADGTGQAILTLIYEHFKGAPVGFEACAARLWQMQSPRVTRYDLTRPSRDGGRDAVGYYGLGPAGDVVELDFALEAKCFAPTSGIGVEAQSRLISRLRPRQFGVLVTTSYVSEQAYKELREDRHPVIVIAGRDIVEILRQHQLSTPADVSAWLLREFPPEAQRGTDGSA